MPSTGTIFTHVTVVDVRDGQRLPDQTVVVVGNRIHALARSGHVQVPKGARVVHAQGKFLIPGLWDMHVHPMQYPDIAYPLFIATGVTGVRDAGSDVPLTTLRRWKREIAAGTRVGPRLLVSGPSINEAPDSQVIVTYNREYRYNILVPMAAARRVVDSLQAAGADMIKPYTMSREMRLAIAAEARRVGIPFGGHSLDTPGLEFSDSGAAFLDHETYFRPDVCGNSFPAEFDAEQCAAAAQRLRRNNTWVTLGNPLDIQWGWMQESMDTLLKFAEIPAVVDLSRRYVPASFPHHPRDRVLADSEIAVREPTSTTEWANYFHQHAQRVLDANLRSYTALHTAGMPILVGTDVAFAPVLIWYNITPGFSLHRTLVSFVLMGGLTPLEALQTATLNPALALRATDSLGTVEAGKVADLVLLDADPLTDIWNTMKIRAVIANGRYFDRAALDRLLVQAEQAAAHR